jgi:hypothetical protein
VEQLGFVQYGYLPNGARHPSTSGRMLQSLARRGRLRIWRDLHGSRQDPSDNRSQHDRAAWRQHAPQLQERPVLRYDARIRSVPQPSSRITAWVGSLSAVDVQVAVEDALLDYTVILGDIKSVLGRYTDLTGKAAVPPPWSLGYWQSKISYKSAEEALGASRPRD